MILILLQFPVELNLISALRKSLYKYHNMYIQMEWRVLLLYNVQVLPVWLCWRSCRLRCVTKDKF